MFTGLIEEVGEIKVVKESAHSIKLGIKAEKIMENISLGDSVSVNGVCLTITSIEDMDFKFNSIEEAIEDIKQGKMIIVVDDEDRENEGDLVTAGEKVTGETMNFISRYARGLICTPMDGEAMDRLSIGQMVEKNTEYYGTDFGVAVDAVGTTTGISAFERSFTVNKLADPNSKPEDFLRPGHVFPLRARENGVLDRTGHTEATVDLVKLAGFKTGVGICCEIMKEDGHSGSKFSTWFCT